MDLAHFRMLLDELFNKDPDIVPEEPPLIVLDIKSAIFMSENGKDTKHTRHMARNREKCKMHKIYCCKRGLQFADIATNNVGEHDLTPSMKYTMVRLEN